MRRARSRRLDDHRLDHVETNMLEVDIKTGDRSAFSLKSCVDKLSLVLLGIVYVSFIGSSDCCRPAGIIYIRLCWRRQSSIRLCCRKFRKLLRPAGTSLSSKVQPASTISENRLCRQKFRLPATASGNRLCRRI